MTMKGHNIKRILFVTLSVAMGFAFVAANLMKPRSFYKNYGDFGAAYIPLVEPYKAIKLLGKQANGDEHKWAIDLLVSPEKKDTYYYLSIYDVTKIAVEKNVIMAYSPDSISLTNSDKSVGQKV